MLLLNYMFYFQVTKAKLKRFGCLCCKSGPLKLKVMLNKKGFVPGEYIDIKVEVNWLQKNSPKSNIISN